MKHKKQIAWSAAAAAILAAALFQLVPGGKPAPNPEAAAGGLPGAEPAFPAPDFKLAMRFLGAASATEDGGVFAFSPLTLTENMALLYAGAGGDSQCDLSDLFGFHGSPAAVLKQMGKLNEAMLTAADGTMNIACAVLFNKLHGSVNPQYRELLKAEPLTALADIDFSDSAAACKTVNDWASANTKGRIADIADPGSINASTICVILSAFHFKDVWKDEFTPGGSMQFTVEPEVTVQTLPAMSRTGSCPYAENGSWQYAELEFGTSGATMALLLPKEFASARDLASGTGAEEIAELLAAARANPCKVAITVPPFKVENAVNCKALMEQLGMDGWGDFQQLATPSPVIDLVQQKNYFDFNAKGAEAASVTATMMTTSIDVTPPVGFTADHPFLWFLLDKQTGTVLMAGWFAGQ